MSKVCPHWDTDVVVLTPGRYRCERCRTVWRRVFLPHMLESFTGGAPPREPGAQTGKGVKLPGNTGTRTQRRRRRRRRKRERESVA